MRPARAITAEEENFRTEPMFPDDPALAGMDVIKRDPVQPEPIGTIVLKAFRVIDYDRDCDGSLMARLENIESDGEATGWEVGQIGLYPSSTLVVDSVEELKALFDGNR
jgi:hypothetical protein